MRGAAVINFTRLTVAQNSNSIKQVSIDIARVRG